MPSLQQKGRLTKNYYQENADQLKAATRAQYQAETEKNRVALEAALAATLFLRFCLILGSSGSLKLVCIFLIVIFCKPSFFVAKMALQS